MGFLDKLNRRITAVWDDLTLPEQLREELDQAERALTGAATKAGASTGASAVTGTSAEALLAGITAQHPELLRGWTLLGMFQARRRDYNAALSSFERACKLRPEEPSLLVSLAEVQQELGQRAAAIQSYKRALSQKVDQPLLAQIFGALGAIYLEAGDAEHAVRELRKAAALGEGQDLEVVGRLGQAQRRAGDLRGAKISLERAAAAPSREVLLALADTLVDLALPQEARLAALRLLELDEQDVQGRCALARAWLADEELEHARQELLRALQGDPRSVEAHLLLGEVHRSAHDPEVALSHLRIAEELMAVAPDAADGNTRTPISSGIGTDDRTPDQRQLLRLMLQLELELEDHPDLGRDAGRLLTLSPEEPWGLACAALADLERPEAHEQLRRSLAQEESFAAHYGLGRLHLKRGDPALAAASLRVALRLNPRSEGAREQLQRAYAAMSGIDPGLIEETELYPLLGRVQALMISHPALTPLAAEAAQIQEIHDRPLLVTVMGEFNSGKSTFINAFIGERIAPMGVTPTTATINVLKYGARRSARVIWRDDRQQSLEWSQVGKFLGQLDDEQSRQIRVVELLYPAEELLRVNVVDTPGLNSVFDAHEQTAREYLAQADAVIWLFSALQAGRQSEEQALELIREYRLKTVGVINKIDCLSAEELEQVQSHLEASFASLVEAIIPVSARQGLEALQAEGMAGLEESRFPELCGFLERRLFSRSLSIKREVCLRKAGVLLQRGATLAAGAVSGAERRLEALEGRAARITAQLSGEVQQQERAQLVMALDQVYRRGAEEVLDFVRPRRWALGSHEAAPADRDFLVELLLSSLQDMTDASSARLGEQLRRSIRAAVDAAPAPEEKRGEKRDEKRVEKREERLVEGQGERRVQERGAIDGELSGLVETRLSLLQQQVYARFMAFARGALRGGQVDAFFSRRLPRLELTLEAIHEALAVGGLEPEEELWAPLAAWYSATVASIRDLLHRQQSGAVLERMELDQRLWVPVLTLQRRIAALGSSDGEPRKDEPR